MSKDIFKVIERPYLTEKVSGLMQEANQYAFKVNPKSSKLEIKKESLAMVARFHFPRSSEDGGELNWE